MSYIVPCTIHHPSSSLPSPHCPLHPLISRAYHSPFWQCFSTLPSVLVRCGDVHVLLLLLSLLSPSPAVPHRPIEVVGMSSKSDKLKQKIAKHLPLEVRNRHAPTPSSTSSPLPSPSPPLPPSSFPPPPPSSGTRDLRPSTVSAHVAAEKRRLVDEEREKEELSRTADSTKRQRVGSSQPSTSTLSNATVSPLHVPDPNAAPDRVKRKTAVKPVTTSSTSAPPSQSSPVPSTPSTSSAPLHGLSDAATESLFYQTVLSWDLTQPREASDEAAPPSSAISSSPSPSPSPSVSPPPLPPPPTTFPSAFAYQTFFHPLLLQDFLAQLQQSYDANLSLPHSLSAQIHPLHVTSVDGREGRGVITDMLSVDLMGGGRKAAGGGEGGDRRKGMGGLREWMYGDLAMLRHHVVEDVEEDRGERATGGRREGAGRRGKRRKGRLGRVDFHVMCVIDSVDPLYSNSEDAPLCSARVRVHLPLTQPTPPRVRSMWETLHPPVKAEVEEKRPSDRGRRVQYDGLYSLIRLDSPVTTMREFLALQHIDSLSLLPHLLNPNPAHGGTTPFSPPLLSASSPVVSPDVEQSFVALPEKFRHFLSSHLNEYQLKAVKVSAARCRQPGFTLLQGPPGTGQSLSPPCPITPHAALVLSKHSSSLATLSCSTLCREDEDCGVCPEYSAPP